MRGAFPKKYPKTLAVVIQCTICIWLSSFSIPASGQKSSRVIEASSRKKPQWLGISTDDYLAVMGEGTTLETAQESALQSLRKQISDGIAVQVMSKTEIFIVNSNGISREEIRNSIVSTSVDLPGIKGILLSKASDAYWVKLRHPDGSISYQYFTRYPFGNAELQMLILEYEQSKNMVLDSLRSVEKRWDIGWTTKSMLKDFQFLQSTMAIYKDERLTAAKTLKQTLESRIEALQFVPDSASTSRSQCGWLRAGAAMYTPETALRYAGGCAQVLNTYVKGEKMCFDLDLTSCNLDVGMGSLKLELPDVGTPKKFVEYTFPLDLNKVSFELGGTLEFKETPSSKGYSLVMKAKLDQRTRDAMPIAIKKVVLSSFGGASVIGTLKNVPGKGMVEFELMADAFPEKVLGKQNVFKQVDLQIHYENLRTGRQEVWEQKNVKFILKK